jgi:O-succinylbenzoate synthase
MKINEINLYTYHLPLIKSLNINDQTIKNREGIIIRVLDNKGNYSYGEIAPLPGLHRENLEDALKQANEICSKLIDTNIPGLQGVYNIFDNVILDNQILPSVRFGFESALVNLFYARSIDPSKEISSSPVHKKILVNGLITGEAPDAFESVKKRLEDGFVSIKVKVGRYSLDGDIDLVRAIYKMLDGRASLRLDANRFWDLNTAEKFVLGIKDCKVEYIEEPLHDSNQLSQLYKATGIPIGLDETIHETDPVSFQPQNWINALILKPAVIGSLKDTLQFMQIAAVSGLKIVISDTFHSGVGLSFLIHLAASLNEVTPMGFDTYQWLTKDILINHLEIKNGRFDLAEVLERSQYMDFSQLEYVRI